MTKCCTKFGLFVIITCILLRILRGCNIEYSKSILGDTFKWEAINGFGTYLSEPICLDSNSNVVQRECRNRKWHPEKIPECHRFVCPQPFITIKSECRYISEPRIFENGCSHIKNTSYDRNTTDFVWVHKKRKIEESDESEEDLDCIVENRNKNRKYVKCSSLYSHVCSYKTTRFLRLPENVEDIDVILKFNPSENNLLLTVYSPESLKTIDEEDSVRCFTNSEGYVIREVDVDKVYDSRKTEFKNFRNFVVYKLELEDEPGEYWCEVYQIDRYRPISTDKVIGYKHKNGNEYSLRVVVELSCWKIICNIMDFYELIEKQCKEWKITCRLMEVFNSKKRDFLVHITTKRRQHVIGEFYKLKNTFVVVLSKYAKVVYFRSSDVCLPDVTISGNKRLYWKLTQIGSVAQSKELCFKSNGMIVTRTCVGDFLYGVEWSPFLDKCSDEIQLPERTKYIYELVTNNVTISNFKNLTLFTEQSDEMSSVDVAFLSDGLYQISLQNYSSNLTEDFTKSVSNLIKMNGDVLYESQSLLNSTDKILDALEIFLSKKSKLEFPANVTIITKSNFLILITKPFVSNVTGLALYGNDVESFLAHEVILISRNETFDNLMMDNLELAVYVPENLLQSLIANLTFETAQNLTIIITVFYNDSLFNSNNTNLNAGSRVVGVTIPGYGMYLQTPIPLLFRPLSNSTNADCAYWDYGQNSHQNKGEWSTVGKNFFEMLHNDSLMQCGFSHLTHFALLIMSERIEIIEDSEGVYAVIDSYRDHNVELSIITAVGCCLSLIGIVGIFLTGILFKKWRDKLGTKILLQLSIAIILEIVATQLAGIDNLHYNDKICTFIGILLQYIVLSKFAWMLLIAFLQYLRYVKVLGAKPSRLVLKATLIGWLIPTIPVILTTIIFPNSYSAGVQNFCYPKGLALYIGLVTPVVIIIIANLAVFATIMLNISRSKALKYDTSGKLQRRQAYLAILLFFMLGMPWIFGILAEILWQNWFEIVFVYLFCLTATLQGFVLFLFYVVIDKETRTLWTNYFKMLI